MGLGTVIQYDHQNPQLVIDTFKGGGYSPTFIELTRLNGHEFFYVTVNDTRIRIEIWRIPEGDGDPARIAFALPLVIRQIKVDAINEIKEHLEEHGGSVW